MKRLIVLNRYFFPDLCATSQILSDLMFHLAGRGEDVHVITSRQLYNDPTKQLPAEETVRGVSIHRLSTRDLVDQPWRSVRSTISRFMHQPDDSWAACSNQATYCSR